MIDSLESMREILIKIVLVGVKTGNKDRRKKGSEERAGKVRRMFSDDCKALNSYLISFLKQNNP